MLLSLVLFVQCHLYYVGDGGNCLHLLSTVSSPVREFLSAFSCTTRTLHWTLNIMFPPETIKIPMSLIQMVRSFTAVYIASQFARFPSIMKTRNARTLNFSRWRHVHCEQSSWHVCVHWFSGNGVSVLETVAKGWVGIGAGSLSFITDNIT